VLLQVVVCLMLLVGAQFVLLLFIFHLGCCCLLHTLYSCCSFWVVIAHLVLLVLALGYYCLSCVVAPCLTLLLVGTCDLHTQCEGGEIGEEVRSVGKVTRETKGIPSSSVNFFFFLFP
jgi:hypothetical protein